MVYKKRSCYLYQDLKLSCIINYNGLMSQAMGRILKKFAAFQEKKNTQKNK